MFIFVLFSKWKEKSAKYCHSVKKHGGSMDKKKVLFAIFPKPKKLLSFPVSGFVVARQLGWNVEIQNIYLLMAEKLLFVIYFFQTVFFFKSTNIFCRWGLSEDNLTEWDFHVHILMVWRLSDTRLTCFQKRILLCWAFFSI